MSDPRAVARAYLAANKVDRLFEELGSSLLLARPADVDSFLLQRLEEVKERRAARQESSALFSDEDLGTLFDMQDAGQTGRISKAQCLAALAAIGVDAGPEREVKLDDKPLSKPAFMALCKSHLTL